MGVNVLDGVFSPNCAILGDGISLLGICVKKRKGAWRRTDMSGREAPTFVWVLFTYGTQQRTRDLTLQLPKKLGHPHTIQS